MMFNSGQSLGFIVPWNRSKQMVVWVKSSGLFHGRYRDSVKRIKKGWGVSWQYTRLRGNGDGRGRKVAKDATTESRYSPCAISTFTTICLNYNRDIESPIFNENRVISEIALLRFFSSFSNTLIFLVYWKKLSLIF